MKINRKFLIFFVLHLVIIFVVIHGFHLGKETSIDIDNELTEGTRHPKLLNLFNDVTGHNKPVEGFTSVNPERKEGFVSNECPTTMIREGDKILLYNPKMVDIPGVNPIRLNSINEYQEYVRWQHASGLNCPLLHLEKTDKMSDENNYEIKNNFSAPPPAPEPDFKSKFYLEHSVIEMDEKPPMSVEDLPRRRDLEIQESEIIRPPPSDIDVRPYNYYDNTVEAW